MSDTEDEYEYTQVKPATPVPLKKAKKTKKPKINLNELEEIFDEPKKVAAKVVPPPVKAKYLSALDLMKVVPSYNRTGMKI